MTDGSHLSLSLNAATPIPTFLIPRDGLPVMTTEIGFLVNPIAGMGGRVGLKGTDSEEVLNQVRELGAEPVSPGRAATALRELRDSLEDESLNPILLTGPNRIGEAVAEECGFRPIVVGDIDGESTTPADTKAIASEFLEREVDVILFAGGDGTARDILDAVGNAVPVVGIPAGVKIYSAVFSPTPKAAGKLVASFLDGETAGTQLREVMDIDEDAYRDDQLSATLYGYLAVPQADRLVQNPKSAGSSDETVSKRAIAREIVDSMDEETTYVIGPGTTTKEILDHLGLDFTLLGVDAVRNGELVGSDLNERELLELADGVPAHIVVGVIGGQGFIFGRGNQQLSPRVIKAIGVANITVVATETKLLSLGDGVLRVDTGDESLNESLSGYRRVVTGNASQMVIRVAQ
ncbi:ATP-NAD kinase family protein [Natronosalvus halobius]|uniref:ATP-NAD kinase family protein n=1 Tax=Natronosalvus halobius TaxID=2953746 RepID=UPI0020A007DE|nr:ATP-NAD kinase family protein [Natronosalvus halobius]USZ73702.1 ATP-NAD kinase family protein [Natronosalvus halobius]